MKPFYNLCLLTLITSLCTSCYVTHPRYSTVEEIMDVELGMSLDSANVILQSDPYDLVSRTDSSTTYRYKYRMTDVRRVPKAQKRNSGMNVEGRFRDFYVTVNNDNSIFEIYTSEEAVGTEVKKKNVDVMGIITVVSDFIIITLPSLLVYLSIN